MCIYLRRNTSQVCSTSTECADASSAALVAMTLCRRRQNHTRITASEIADTMKDAALAEILATVRKELAQKTKPAGALDRIDDLVLRSEEHTSELQSRGHLVCRLLL